MSSRICAARASVALSAVLACACVHAATVVIEPDTLPSKQPVVAPGALISTFRYDGRRGWTKHPVYTDDGAPWAPTGVRVFGHQKVFPSETTYHWDNLLGAYDCEHDADCVLNFYVFRVDFEHPTKSVQVLTTLRGEIALDGAELWAFDANGDWILRCVVEGVNSQVLAGGALPPPIYLPGPIAGPGPIGAPCGKVLNIKNCPPPGSPDPGNCDYVVSLNVQSRRSEIAYVWFGGLFFQGSFATVDRLSYWLP